jgi:hypothetical protein
MNSATRQVRAFFFQREKRQSEPALFLLDSGGADGTRTRDLRRDRPSRASGGIWKRLEREHIAFRLLSSGSVWKRRKRGY